MQAMPSVLNGGGEHAGNSSCAHNEEDENPAWIAYGHGPDAGVDARCTAGAGDGGSRQHPASEVASPNSTPQARALIGRTISVPRPIPCGARSGSISTSPSISTGSDQVRESVDHRRLLREARRMVAWARSCGSATPRSASSSISELCEVQAHLASVERQRRPRIAARPLCFLVEPWGSNPRPLACDFGGPERSR